jgi:anti-anti-sigma factor
VPSVNIFDLTEVPYMDSCGLGLIVGHFVRCQSKGVPMIAADVGPRVLELFKTTKTDQLFPMTTTVDEALNRAKPRQ